MKRKQLLLTAIMSLLLLVNSAAAQTTAFTYQGKLTDSGNLANGNYDLQFKLFDALSAGTQQGSTQTLNNVAVTNGIFTVSLDFGVCAACFNGAARFLEIAVRPAGGGSFTTLTPRQPITSTPYAINAAQLGGLAASGFLQNSTSQQAASNFNISGDGTAGGNLSANILNATTQFNLGGQRVLSVVGTNNLFAGINAGTNPNNTGSNNAFFGFQAGQMNTIGFNNSFFGTQAGQANTAGQQNAIFGAQAGQANTTGFDNAFFGTLAGIANSTGGGNAFFGSNAGQANTIGNFNTFIGKSADFDLANPTGNNNTLLGFASRVTANLSNATAIGSRAQVAQSNSLVLGGITGINSGTNVNVGIGTTTPAALLDVQRDGATFPETARFTTFGTDNKILSRASGGSRSAPTATPSGRDLLSLGATGHDGTQFVNSPKANIVFEAAESWTSTAQGTRIRFNTTTNGTTTISSSTPRMTIEDDGSVGIGTSAPGAVLDVQRDGNTIPETARFTTYGFANEILGLASGGTRAAPTATSSGQILLQLGAVGHDGAGFGINPKATIQLSAAEDWTASAQGTRIRFNTTAIGTTIPNTKMIITDDGSVGIGTSTPTARLDVNGDVKVNGNIIIPAQTRHLSIPAAGFTLTYSAQYQFGPVGIDVENDGNGLNVLMIATAMVNLPDGAVVTRVRANVSDHDVGSGQNIQVQLTRKGLTGENGTESAMSNISSSGTGNNLILSDTSISNATIDNNNFCYYVWVTSPGGPAGTWKLWSVIIDYTVTTPLP